MKEYTVKFQFDLGDCQINNIGYMTAFNTEELDKKMYPFSYEIIGVRLFREGV